jgi:tyrosyl-tRNA synthetase
MTRPPHFDDVDYLLDGFERVESIEEFRDRLMLGRPLNVKLGIDPTTPDLHLGFMVVLHALQKFAESGHNVTLIIGDFTARIGDPSGKKITRPHLTTEEIEANMNTYREQAGRVLDLERIALRYNSEWLDKLTHADLIRLAAKTTVAQMLERNDFHERYDAGDAISLHELLYPIAMAYDSVMVDADVELGGTDQLFNLLMGRHYQRELGQLPQICAMVPLLVGLDGVQKMSKSLGNYVGVTEPPDVQFGKLMSIPDDLITDYARQAAFRSREEVASLKEALDSGRAKPMDEKKRVAQDIVARYHGAEAAAKAREFFEKTVQRKELPSEMPVHSTTLKCLSAVLVELGLESSRRGAERLITQGGVKIDNIPVSDPNAKLDSESVILSAKHRHFRINRSKPRA